MSSLCVKFLDRYQSVNTRKRYATVLNQFLTFLNRPLEEATPEEVDKYNAFLKEMDYSGRTIKSAIDVLRKFYRFLEGLGVITSNPVIRADVKAPNKYWNEKRPTQLTPFHQVRRICNAPSRFSKEGIRDRGILACLYGGGLRGNEVIGLKLDDVRTVITDEGTGVIYYLNLRHTKAQKSAKQALPDWAAEEITRVIEVRKAENATSEDPLFVWYYADGTHKNAPLSYSTYKRTFFHYRDLCGLPKDITPHSARATAISRLLDLGIPHREVKEFGRFASITTVEEYDKRYFGVENSVAKKLKYG